MPETMKISCLQENLHRGLSVVGRAVNNKSSLPIISNVLMATDQGQLKLTGTNLDISITTWVGAMIEAEGSTTLPHQLLADLVGHMPADRVDFTLGSDDPDVNDDSVMHIKHGRSTTRINTADAADYPTIPTVDSDQAVEIPVATLRAGVKLTAFSAATDETRPVLTGILLKIEDNHLYMAAADGFRLSIFEHELPQAVSNPVRVIVPARAMRELDRIAAQQTAPVKIHVPEDPNHIMFAMDNVEIVVQLLNGNFPNVEHLIPDNYQTVATMEVDSLKRAVQSASVFARDGSNIVRMEFTPNEHDGEADDAASRDTPAPAGLDPADAVKCGQLTVSAKSQDTGSSTDLVDLEELVGEPNRIAFNVRYLSDAINIMDKGKATIGINSTSAPGVIQMLDNPAWKHVAMPMYVDWS